MIGEIDSFVFIIRLNGIKWEREREREGEIGEFSFLSRYTTRIFFLKRNFKTDASRFSAVPPFKWDGNFCARLHKAGIAETILRAASLLPKL